jgi:transcriptional regulator with XRE-family HTH domain
MNEYAPRDAVRSEFAHRLTAERLRKGWNQSDLARAAALHIADKRFGRDLVSSYERGRMLPGALHLNALAKALGVDPSTLIPPNIVNSPTQVPPLSMQDMGDGTMWLRINQRIDFTTGLEIMRLLKAADPPPRSS